MKSGKVAQKVFEKELIVEGGRVGKFNLKSTYMHRDEDFSRVNYYDPEYECQMGEITFEFNGYKLKAVDWQVVRIINAAVGKMEKAVQALGYNHYIICKCKIDGKERDCGVAITESEYKAIKEWFESVKVTKPVVKKEVKKPDYSKEIAEAKKSGKLVIINRYAKSIDHPESDTAIVTVYVDGDGKITSKTELMD